MYARFRLALRSDYLGPLMNAYLMYGPNDGQFVQVPGLFPPKILRYPMPSETEARAISESVPVGEAWGQVAEYYLDSVLPMPAPLRGKIATYRFRRITPTKETNEQE